TQSSNLRSPSAGELRLAGAKFAEHGALNRFGGRREAAARPGSDRDTSLQRFPTARISARSRLCSSACTAGRPAETALARLRVLCVFVVLFFVLFVSSCFSW